jgi:hypothetical protein
MKNKIIIFLYALLFIGLLIEIFKSGFTNVRVYQIVLILCFSWILFNKIKELIKDNNTEIK